MSWRNGLMLEWPDALGPCFLTPTNSPTHLPVWSWLNLVRWQPAGVPKWTRSVTAICWLFPLLLGPDLTLPSSRPHIQCIFSGQKRSLRISIDHHWPKMIHFSGSQSAHFHLLPHLSSSNPSEWRPSENHYNPQHPLDSQHAWLLLIEQIVLEWQHVYI